MIYEAFFEYLWQLPQNILGLIVIWVTKSKKIECGNYYKTELNIGVSLGSYIIIGNVTETTLKHEKGHQKQSLYLGWLYLLIVGIPSISRNIYDRLFHRKWTNDERIKWYYSQFPEKQADELGRVERIRI